MNHLPKLHPKMPDLPSSCCCGQVKLPTATRFFAILRLCISIPFVLTTLEELFKSDFEEEIEIEFDEEFLAKYDESELKQLQTENHNRFLAFYYSITSIALVLGVIELIVCSLQIHGIRKNIVNFVLPYLIWTGITMAVFSLLFLLIFIAFVRNAGRFGLVVSIGAGGFLAFIITDFIYALANYKRIRTAVGMDHVRLNEI